MLTGLYCLKTSHLQCYAAHRILIWALFSEGNCRPILCPHFVTLQSSRPSKSEQEKRPQKHIMNGFPISAHFRWIMNDARNSLISKALKNAVGKHKVSNKPSSVSRQFGESLSRLMKTLGQATPYFIRCIKSNNEKVVRIMNKSKFWIQIPNLFDDNIILRQLRYTGMLETVRIRRAGYSVRIEYDVCLLIFFIILSSPHSLVICKPISYPLAQRTDYLQGGHS